MAPHPQQRPPKLRGLVLVGTAVAAAALVAARLLQRGPVTTGQVLTLIVLMLALGVGAGALVRARALWVVAPVAFVVAFEVANRSTGGPTWGAIHLDSQLGVMTFLLGRGLLAVLALLPLLVGCAYGRRLARRRGPAQPSARGHRPVGLGLATVLLVVLVAAFLRPASTPAIPDADGDGPGTSIAELTSVEVGGVDQALLLRGQDATADVVLYLAGGPGGTDLGAMRLFGEHLERSFVVATWDQRGAGKSYPALEPTSTLTLERAVDDMIEVTNHLRERFDQDRIYVVGNSWGTTLGVLAVQRRPELYHAYVGTAQMVSQRETDRLMYADRLAAAEAAGDDRTVRVLRANGPPPYPDVTGYAPLLVQPPDNAAVEMPATLMVREYRFIEQLTAFPATFETFAVLYPQLQGVDLREDAPALDVPVVMVTGTEEEPGRSVLADAWFDALEAPSKQRVELDDAGHRPHLQQPEAFADVMRELQREVGS